jgi:hypothetical protein
MVEAAARKGVDEEKPGPSLMNAKCIRWNHQSAPGNVDHPARLTVRT